MLSRVVLPQPLGPTMARNSPSATDTETSDKATTSRSSVSRQYRFETCSICSLGLPVIETPGVETSRDAARTSAYATNCGEGTFRYFPKASLALRCSSALMEGPNNCSKKPS